MGNENLDLKLKLEQTLDGMNEFKTEAKKTLERIVNNYDEVMNKHYQANHAPFAVLDFPKEVEYWENLLAGNITRKIFPNYNYPDNTNWLEEMQRRSYVVIRGDLKSGSTIHFDPEKLQQLYINGEEYTGDYTFKGENENTYEKTVLLAVQTPYYEDDRYLGHLIIKGDDFPLENIEIHAHIGHSAVQPDVTDLLEDDSCISLYVRGDWKWMTNKYCPIRTLSVTGLLMMQSTYKCPNLQYLIVPNTTNLYKKGGGTSSYRYIDISNMTGNINDNACDSASLYGAYTINNSGSIGQYAFQNCSGLTSVTIGNSVTNIGSNAFQYCSGLTSVTIGNSVTSIGNNAFQYCSGLTSVTIGNSVTSIGQYTFSGCTGLTSVTIGNSVTGIGQYAFSGCTGLTSVTIGNSVTSIGNNAFQSCSGLTSVIVTEGYHCPITYIQYSQALNWECFREILQNCANVGEDGRTAETMQFKVASAVRTALTNAYNVGDETAVAIYELMSEKSITITT